MVGYISTHFIFRLRPCRPTFLHKSQSTTGLRVCAVCCVRARAYACVCGGGDLILPRTLGLKSDKIILVNRAALTFTYVLKPSFLTQFSTETTIYMHVLVALYNSSLAWSEDVPRKNKFDVTCRILFPCFVETTFVSIFLDCKTVPGSSSERLAPLTDAWRSLSPDRAHSLGSQRLQSGIFPPSRLTLENYATVLMADKCKKKIRSKSVYTTFHAVIPV